MTDDQRSAPELDESATDTSKTKSFQTPNEAAAADDLHPNTGIVTSDDVAGKASAGENWFKQLRQKINLGWPPGKKEWLGSAIIIVVCGSIVGFVLNHTGTKPVANATQTKVVRKVAPKPAVLSTLTGLPVQDEAVNKRAVTGVMVENSPDARPQSGLSEAGIVFEAIAEGGITRFLALHQDTGSENIGPVRSARPYYAQWALGFDAGYAHVGGSPEALANIKAWGVRDLDQFYNAGAYRRIADRRAPHNVYTGIGALTQLEASKGYTSSTYTGFVRNAKAAPSKQPNAKNIDLALSGPLYNVHYGYNAATNSYDRSEGGAPHVDANTNHQISPKVVVALVMPYSLQADGYHSEYGTIGSGQVFVFQDGVVATGTWTKTANNAQFTFADAAGKPLKLSPGQTWLTAVSAANKVTYAP